MNLNDQKLFVHSSKNQQPQGLRYWIGNGYLGIQPSSNLGQGFGISTSGKMFPEWYLGGVFDYKPNKVREKRATVHRPLNLAGLFFKNDAALDFLPDITNYSQKMDYATGVISTTYQYQGFKIDTEFQLYRQFPHLGSLIMKFDPLTTWDGKITLQYKIQKHVDAVYEEFEYDFDEQDEIFTLFGTIKEDTYYSRGLEKFTIGHAAKIQALTLEGEPLSIKHHIAEIDFDGFSTEEEEASIIDTVEIDVPTKEAFQIRVIFGIMKETDLKWVQVEVLDLLSKLPAPREELAQEKIPLVNIPSQSKEGREQIHQKLNEALGEKIKILQSDLLEAQLTNEKCWREEIWSKLIHTDNQTINQHLISCYYHLASTFRSDQKNSTAPTGLGNYPWDGHIFWDADLWVNMGVAPLFPEFSRCIVEYRSGPRLAGALQACHDYKEDFEMDQNLEGAKWPWQSTGSGLETAPMGWEAQEHIACDVLYGQWLYFVLTNDKDYLQRHAFPIFYETCRYFYSRIEKDEKGLFHFRGVIPPDEHIFPGLIDDNAFTNLFVDWCFQRVIELGHTLDKEIPQGWKEIPGRMVFYYDEDHNIIQEHYGYSGNSIKQADTNLLSFPLNWPFKRELLENNLTYYFKKLPENHIMMASAIFSIVAAQLGHLDKAWFYFQDLFPHFHEDLGFIMSESPVNTCQPFITGIGGYLANFIYGFGGLQFRAEGIYLNPQYHEEIGTIAFEFINYRGFQFKYQIVSKTEFKIEAISGARIYLMFSHENCFIPKILNVEIENHSINELFSAQFQENSPFKKYYANRSEKWYTIKFDSGEHYIFEKQRKSQAKKG